MRRWRWRRLTCKFLTHFERTESHYYYYSIRPASVQPDPDLREYQRRLALSAIDERTAKINPSKPIQRRHKTKPLFDFDEDENDMPFPPAIDDEEEFNDDPELAFALQESLDHFRPHVTPSPSRGRTTSHSSPSTTSHRLPTPRRSSSSLRRVDRDSDDDEDMYGSSRLEMALAIANAGPVARRTHISPLTSPFGKPTLLNANPNTAHPHSASPLSFPVKNLPKADGDDDDDEEMEEVFPASLLVTASESAQPTMPSIATRERPVEISPMRHHMEEIKPFQPPAKISSSKLSAERPQRSLPISQTSPLLQDIPPPPLFHSEVSSPSHVELPAQDHDPPALDPPTSAEYIPNQLDSEDEDEALTDWSRSPSPIIGLQTDVDASAPRPPSTKHETWDAAQEMDPHAEEGEFVRFISQVKGRDLDDVRAEIDEEIKSLNKQKKAAMRDSEDITQQMISQIMVRRIHAECLT
jgi:DNA excision repair protein ERCC-5